MSSKNSALGILLAAGANPDEAYRMLSPTIVLTKLG